MRAPGIRTPEGDAAGRRGIPGRVHRNLVAAHHRNASARASESKGECPGLTCLALSGHEPKFMTITTLEGRVGVAERVIIVQWDFYFGLGHEYATESFGTG